MNKTLIATAMVAALGASAAQADVYNFTGEGVFTMITTAGGVQLNPDAAGTIDAFGTRTQLSGLTMSFDTATGAGSATFDPFLFSGTLVSLNDLTMQAIGDGNGGPGTLVMSSISIDFGPSIGIPAYMVSDATGLFGAIDGGLSVGDVITGGVASSSDAAIAATGFGAYTPALGNIPFAMTTLDVNQDASGNLVDGGFPLSDDGISGVRTATAPFAGPAFNIDFTAMCVSTAGVPPLGDVYPVQTGCSIPSVPIPSAVWLFGSGLIGLIGVARRKV